MKCGIIFSLAIIGAFCCSAAVEKEGVVPIELERLISDVEMRAKQVGPEAERARAALPQLYAIRRRLHNAEDDMRRALTAGREQLREFMKCDAMKVLTKSQKDEVRKFAVELDDVIANSWIKPVDSMEKLYFTCNVRS